MQKMILGFFILVLVPLGLWSQPRDLSQTQDLSQPREKKSVQERFREGLTGKKPEQPPPIQFLEGMLTRVTDSESVWVRIDNKRIFYWWVFKLSKNNFNESNQEIRVWLRYVSPQRSVSRGKKYNDWFQKKAAYEMAKEFINRWVVVDYQYNVSTARMVGMVRSADISLNVWLVHQGWSYYILEEANPIEQQDFIDAEKHAQTKQLGLWQAIPQEKIKQ